MSPEIPDYVTRRESEEAPALVDILRCPYCGIYASTDFDFRKHLEEEVWIHKEDWLQLSEEQARAYQSLYENATTLRSRGGPVPVRLPTLVGEAGPEQYVPGGTVTGAPSIKWTVDGLGTKWSWSTSTAEDPK